MNKKGDVQTSMLNQLVHLILGAIMFLLVLGILVWVGYKAFFQDEANPTEKSFEALVEEINSLKDGEEKSVPVFVEWEEADTALLSGHQYIIIGFKEGEDELKGECYKGEVTPFLTVDLTKQTRSCGGDGCLCLYYMEYGEKDKFLKCVPLDYSPVGGSFFPPEGQLVMLKTDDKKVNLDHEIKFFKLDAYNVGPDDASYIEGRVECNFAVVPPMDKVLIVNLKRIGDEVLVCWGQDCKFTCTQLSEEECFENKDCYPSYMSSPNVDIFTKCHSCDGFKCSDISSGPCYIPGGDCEKACRSNQCGKKCKLWTVTDTRYQDTQYKTQCMS